jgi:NAD kinase
LTKVEANVNGRKVSGMNEINLHYSPPRALRFLLKLNNKIISKELVGDGIVVATPYGSTGYFYSITGRNFNRGLGIAFNNSTKRMKAIITGENSKIHVKILREKGVVCADTNDKIIKIRKGNVILIKKSDKKARMIKLNGNNLKVDIK